ncbi:MAG: flagellar biosynthesis protein flip [Peptococcaceae bacterium BICA1-7]|nr:MAG: flagellar biosynthesis protein flip [Peptococcaceae bacterium BICA1-7]HBV96613.1 flagellar biosynthetic protein FliP [Desulfotomaculum sp.]
MTVIAYLRRWYKGLCTKRHLVTFLVLAAVFFLPRCVQAEPLPSIDLRVSPSDQPTEVVDSVKLLVILSVITLAPAFIMMVTSFTRIIVVLSLLRGAIGTPTAPPNQVMVGLALILTFFIMSPVYGQINENAVKPYLNNQISQEQAFAEAYSPLRTFMLKQTREKDLALFVSISKSDRPQNEEDVPLSVLAPAFAISELKTAFQMGFLLYVPFVVIDIVVASTLMSMGMFMLPPVMIALPFKILLFVMVDGWYLVVKSLVESF